MALRRTYIGLALVLWAGTAAAQSNTTCTCTCFDGRPLQVCANPADAPICGPEVCPPKQALPNTPPPQQPPPSPQQKQCKLEPALNESTGQNEVRLVCK